MRYFYFFVLSLFLCTQQLSAATITGANAQKLIQGAEKVIPGVYNEIPQFIQFKKESQLPYAKFNAWAHITFKLPTQFDFKLLSSETDQLGMTHYRYQETYQGLPVVGTLFMLHTKDNLIASMN